ncbi:NADH dehydrogenase [ubiquinone] 1 alpha subcomplex assembly factor 4 - like 1 [Theobroma cacao]|nr:NADH dehydrogenase [ubiquinone] 1 alpha subcomplex assembly factor 4 - like 1 [Theobroma cacao]
MGQAFRRATGRIRSMDQSKPIKPRRPLGPTDEEKISRVSQYDNLDHERASRSNPENVLEERDPKYDAMLSQMVGRISAKPGGKLEMGEALVAEKPNRPLPKLRNTTPDSGRYEERPVPPGTLNVKQLRHIMLLHQGKADDHDGPMDVHQIAEKFSLDAALVQKILQFMSLPPEDSTKQKK